jgi:hypothetical protein
MIGSHGEQYIVVLLVHVLLSEQAPLFEYFSPCQVVVWLVNLASTWGESPMKTGHQKYHFSPREVVDLSQ